METITDRIKFLVDTLAKSKVDFARKIGITGASISRLYHGKAKPDGSTITAICSVFGVNRTWLETGEGEPFKRDEITARVKKHALPGAMVALVEAFEELTEEEQLAVLRFLDDFAEKVKQEQGQRASEPPAPAPAVDELSTRVDATGLSKERQAMLEEYARQLLLEEKAGGKSSASGRGSTGTDGSRA